VGDWTSPLTNRLLLEAGFAFNYEEYVILNQDGVNKERGTAEWYAGASRADISTGTLWNGFGSANGGRYPDRFTLSSSGSYVTAAHNIKAGLQWSWGPYENTRETNGDLQQEYRSGVPDTVLVRNSPLNFADALMNADVAIFAQDSWTYNAQVDFFNLLNANPIEIVRSFNYGTAGYGLPAQILQARIMKVSALFQF